MIIYYADVDKDGITLYEVSFDKRASFWVDHPRATEISKKEYQTLTNLTLTQNEEPSPNT